MIRLRRRPAVARRPWTEVDCWVLDLEMSGLDAATGRIMAVGMVPVRNRAIRVGEAYSTLVRAAGPLDMSGVATHHLLPDQLAAAPPLDEVVAEIDRRLTGGHLGPPGRSGGHRRSPELDGSLLVVHAAEIDLPFLRRAYRDTGRPWPDPPVVDTLRLLRRHHRHRLVAGQLDAGVTGLLAAARADLGLPPHVAHDALADAVATAELLLVLAQRLGARTVGDLL